MRVLSRAAALYDTTPTVTRRTCAPVFFLLSTGVCGGACSPFYLFLPSTWLFLFIAVGPSHDESATKWGRGRPTTQTHLWQAPAGGSPPLR